MSFNGEQFESFKPKKPKSPVIAGRTKQKNHKTPRAKTEQEPCSQEELNWSEFEKKAFRIELLEICKTGTKKSNPDLLTFYVISYGHDMAIDAVRTTTCRRNFAAPWLQKQRTKNEGSSEKLSFNGEQFENFKPKKTKKSSHRMENKTKEPQDTEGKI